MTKTSKGSRVFPSQTLIAVAISRAGLVNGSKVMAFATCWLIAERKFGLDMTVDEYAELWGQSRAQCFRDQQRWRSVFPEFATPSALWAAAGARSIGSDDQGEVAALVCSVHFPTAA